jgi:tetratricopeptide (TPR) repeat protein
VAFELVDGVLSSRPEDYETRQLHAVLAGQLGHHVKMATDGEEMVRMQGANANAYLWRALAELFLDRPEESLRDVLRALELNEESHWGRAMLGLVLLELRRPSEAMMTLDRVVAEAPQIEMAWLGRAASHAANSDWTRAIADVTRIVENTPTDTDAWLIRGDYNSLQGDQSAAVADYERAIALGGKTNPVMSRWYAAMAKRIRAGVRAPGPITPPNPTEAASSDADTTLTDPKRGSSGLSISDFLAFGR